MKRFIALMLLLLPGLAAAAAYDLLITQQNSTGSGNFIRFVLPPSPAPNTSGVLMFDGSTSMPKHALVGSGLTYDGTTLAAAGGVTSVTAGTGLSGGTITSTGTISMPNTGTAGTIGGPSSITVFLETADTNSTTPGDWTIKAQQVNSSSTTLAVALQVVDVEPWSLCRKIPAGKFVRIRSGSVTGTATASINTQQQETLL